MVGTKGGEQIEDKDEGIVLKDIGSKWEPSDRSGKWLKLKPDYIRAGSDLDVLIIGGYYGSGRRGGEVAQFLVGLAERPAPDTFPRRFVSFCRVGTGLSDEELNSLVTKLKPYLRKYEYPKKASPSFYQVTNNSKERPDVWVESPEKSIIVSITSDIRTIRSEVFAAPYSLRFPRIDRVRYDKPWHECLDVQSFVELVHSSNGTTQKAMDYAGVQENKPKRAKSARGTKKNVSVVPSHFIQTDVSQVKGETSIFSNMIVYFVNTPSSHSLDSLHKMVVENGGSFSMNLNNSVTHCIASESKGIKFQAAKRHGDVIHCSWLFDCCAQKKLVPLQPKYFLFLSDMSKKKLEEEIDKFSDSYYLDLDVTDLKQILSNIGRVDDSKAIEYYKKKICPREEWIRFHGCHIYFHLPRKFLKYSWEVTLELAIRRMKIEICISGGSVAENLFHATHVVIVSSPQIDVDFDTLLSSFPEAERPLLLRRRLQIVKSQWLDDCFEKNKKLPEDSYSLKPQGFEETLSGDSNEHDFTREESPSVEAELEDASKDRRKSKATPDKPKIVSLPNRDGKRKRGRPNQRSLNKGKSVVNQPRRTRPRVENKPAKINEIESDKNSSSDDKEDSKAHSINHGSSEMVKNKRKSGSNQPRTKRVLIKNKPAQIEGNEFDEDSSSEEPTKKEEPKDNEANDGLSETVNLLVPEFQREEAVKDYIPGKNKAVEDGVDPVQAMLLNMVPILATQKVESGTLVHEDVIKARDPDPVPCEEEKVSIDNETQPVKKKKVSYKDVANDLLKDW